MRTTTTTTKRTSSHSRTNRYRHKQGYRSGMEERIAEELREAGVEFSFETMKIPYTPKQKTYTPDFLLPNGIIVETKGYFTSEDRVKHLLIRAQHPELDIRFVFSRPGNRLNKTSRTTYAIWADKHGFKWAKKSIPDTWLREKRKKRSKSGEATKN